MKRAKNLPDGPWKGRGGGLEQSLGEELTLSGFSEGRGCCLVDFFEGEGTWGGISTRTFQTL